MMELRPYQRECLAAIEAAGDGRHLCQLATGLGKTVIFSQIPRHGKTLILSHREELVRQPVKYYDCQVGIEMAGETAVGSNAEVISASIQTMGRRKHKYARNHFEMIIIDECHHAAANSYREILEYFQARRIIGFTATPNRADGVGLQKVFESIIYQRDLVWGIQNKFLSDIRCKRIKIGCDLSKIATHMGDFSAAELSRAVNVDEINDAVAQAVREIAEKPALVFAVDVAHAHEIAMRIPGAVALDGSTPAEQRAETIEKYKKGEIPVLVNCQLFTEGTDLPGTKTVVVARPTKSKALYTQMVGRGTRLAEGKTSCLLIDCVGVTTVHNLCTAPTLIGMDPDDVPEKFQDKLDGDLLQDIPKVIRRLSDTPESWIENIFEVELFARERSYDMHAVRYYKLPDGTFNISFPSGRIDKFGRKEKVTIKMTQPDLLGKVRIAGREENAQKVFDATYEYLEKNWSAQRPFWDIRCQRKQMTEDATEKQLELIKKLAKRKKVDVDGIIVGKLTKFQASEVINHLLDK